MPPPTTAKPRKKQSFLSIGLKILLTLLAFWLAFRDVQWADLQNMLTGQRLELVALAACCIIVQFIAGTLRWRYILAALSDKGKSVISFSEAFKFYYISLFFSNCLPGTIGGDVVRVWITQKEDIPFSLSLNSIIIDRLIALAGLFAVLFFMLPVLAEIFSFNPFVMGATFLVLVALAAVITIRLDGMLARFEHVRPVSWLRYFFNCLRLMMVHYKMTFWSLVFGAISHVFFGLCAYALAVSMGVEVSAVACIALLPLVMLAVTLPISIAGWGVREAMMVFLFAHVGLANAASVAISVQIGLLNILVALPAAFLWLTLKRSKSTADTSNDQPV